MRHLNSYKLFESQCNYKDSIAVTNDILQDLKDEYWKVSALYVPKRWEGTFNKIESDYIDVAIKKNQNKPNNKYPIGSEFNLSDIREYIIRLLAAIDSNKIDISVCYSDDLSSDGYIYGGGFINKSIDYLKSYDIILCINLKIYLKGENLDQFKYN